MSNKEIIRAWLPSIAGVIIVLFIGGGIFAWQYSNLAKEKIEMPEVKTAEEVVFDFYSCYLRTINQEKSSPKAREVCGDYLEDKYKQKLNSEKFFLVDPILWAEDVPPTDNLQVGPAVIEGKTAFVVVTFLPLWPNHKIKVYLSLIDHQWKISEVEDLNTGRRIEDLLEKR
jgi:hypothetical protein